VQNTLSALDGKLTFIDKDDIESEEEVIGVQPAAVLDVFGEGFDSTGIISDAADEVAHRRTLEETYVEELPDMVNIFVATHLKNLDNFLTNFFRFLILLFLLVFIFPPERRKAFFGDAQAFRRCDYGRNITYFAIISGYCQSVLH